jgi:hypothetical protein
MSAIFSLISQETQRRFYRSHMMALLTPLLFLIFCVLMVLRYDTMDSCFYLFQHNEKGG